MATITPLNKLPVVVTELGIYNTRDGRKALVTKIGSNDPTVTQYSVNGTVFGKNGRLINFYTAWHVSGRMYCHTLHGLDLVSKVEKDNG